MQLVPGLIPRAQPLLGPTGIGGDAQVLASDGLGGTYWVEMAAGVTHHGALTGLSDDDHTQYALLAGRVGGQTLSGGTAAGNALTLNSTTHATKGTVDIGGSVVQVSAAGMLYLKQSGNVANTSDYATFPFSILNAGVQHLSIGSASTGVIVQTWASKPLVLNPAGNTVVINGPIDLTRLDAQRLIMFASANARYGYGVQSGELRAFVPSNAALGHTFGTISTADGSTFTARAAINQYGLGVGTTPGSTYPGLSASTASGNYYITLQNTGTGAGIRLFAGGQAGLTSIGSGNLVFYTLDAIRAVAQFRSDNGWCSLTDGASGLSAGGQLHVRQSASGSNPSFPVMVAQAAVGQSGDLLQFRNSSNSTIAGIASNGAIKPASLADAEAPNGSLYYSSTAGTLVFKDGLGVVHALY